MSVFNITLIGDTHIREEGGYHAEDLIIPSADLMIGMGDLVEFGLDTEYEEALKWHNRLPSPFIAVRGNHDSGSWNKYIKQCVPSNVKKQLDQHSLVGKSRMFEWTPMIWRKIDMLDFSIPKQSSWNNYPVDVQDNIVKIRDAVPSYYTYQAGGMLFVCLDTSNWLLGEAQMRWLEEQIKTAKLPVVIVAHHHFLPVGVLFDTCQVHERDFLRSLILNNPNITACLHGHAHFDRWWKYGDTDIIVVSNRGCRTVKFENGCVVESVIDGQQDTAQPFIPEYLCAQTFNPGKLTYLTCNKFLNPWDISKTPCFGWLADEAEEVDIKWSMRLPENISEKPHTLSFQIVNEGECCLNVKFPGSDKQVEKKIEPDRYGQKIIIDLGPLSRGYYEAQLTCKNGYGYVAMAATLDSTMS